MFEDLIKKKENSIKIWGQKTLEKNKDKPIIVWNIKKMKYNPKMELWIPPAGFKRKNN